MLNKGRKKYFTARLMRIRKEHGKNSLLVEFAKKEDLNVIREISGIKKVMEHEKSAEIFPEKGTNMQVLLEELVHRAEILRFERAFPSLSEIFIETVENCSQ